jgi:hypothetical protein
MSKFREDEQWKAIREIRARARAKEEEANQLHAQARRLELAADREKYCCPCVRQGRELDIHDMRAMSAAGRKGVPDCAGQAVYDSLLTLVNCSICHGGGVPL